MSVIRTLKKAVTWVRILALLGAPREGNLTCKQRNSNARVGNIIFITCSEVGEFDFGIPKNVKFPWVCMCANPAHM